MLIFREGLSGEKFIQRYVEYHFRMHKNVVLGIVGKSGQGKSYSACRIAMLVDPKFDPETHIIYHAYLLNQKIEEAIKNHYRVLILDEAHVTLPARTWYEFAQRSIDMVLNTFRALGNVLFIVVTPNFSKIDKSIRELFDLYAVAWRYSVKKPYIDLFEVTFPYYDLIHPVPKLKKIKVRVKQKDGNYKTIIIKKIRIGYIGDNIAEKYEKISKKFKADLLKEQIEMTFSTMSKKECKLIEKKLKEGEEDGMDKTRQ